MATPFSNSMEDGNYPSAGGAQSGERTASHDDALPSKPTQSDDAESRGGDHREIQDNGTRGRNFSVGAGGQASESVVHEPLPPDPYAPAAPSSNYQTAYGITGDEVGHKGNFQSNYGIDGPDAGGGDEKNITA